MYHSPPFASVSPLFDRSLLLCISPPSLHQSPIVISQSPIFTLWFHSLHMVVPHLYLAAPLYIAGPV